MEACGGSVTAWDVVNEPISGGGDDGNGNYALQSATNPDDNGAVSYTHLIEIAK